MATSKKVTPKATTPTAKAGSLSGDTFTLEQVARECIGYQTESESLAEKKGTLSDHFMNAATLYIKKAPKKGEQMLDDHPFLVACKAQETLSKADTAGLYQWDKVPASWSQMKSNIKQAFNIGMNINDYASESEMRKVLNEKRKAAKEENKTDEERALDQVNSALDTMVEGDNTIISQRVFAIIEACKDLTPAQTDDVSNILGTTLENILMMKALIIDQAVEEAETKAA